MAEQIAMDQVAVRVKNIGFKDFDGPAARYANVQYNIPVGTERFVPYLAAVMWFGNPDARDNPTHPDDRDLQFRTLERDRLSTYYGVYDQPWEDRTGFERTAEDINEKKQTVGGESYVDGLHPNLPRIECWVAKPEGDERLWTVIEDPDGSRTGITNTMPQADNSAALERHLKALELQVAKLQRDLAISQPVSEVDADDLDAVDEALAATADAPIEIEDPQPVPGSKAKTDTPPGMRARKKTVTKVGS